MITNRYITAIIAALMAVAVAACVCLSSYVQRADAAADTGVTMEYETVLFDTSEIITLNIIMDEDDWNEMLENALDEEYYACDVEVNGTMFYNVGIRTKGNTSLSNIANDPDTDRYSLKLEFDHYVEGQTCYGLDKLILNNNYADATSMKEALIYDMFQFLSADASLYNYAQISVNGDYWGLYLALEAVEDSFLLRNYGTADGELYKPEGTNAGGGGGQEEHGGPGGDGEPGGDAPERPNEDDEERKEPTSEGDGPGERPDSASGERPDDTSGGGPGGDHSGSPGGDMGTGSGGANLNYSDDDLNSYETIWEGEVTDTTDADHERVVEALENIANGTDLEDSMDVDNLLKYMAVHIFSVNEDSLSGGMAHNYYLYESDGRLNIIPWDYNLALGGMNGGDASSVVNSAIDDAFSSTDFFDTLMENEEYHDQYYAYLQQLVDEYVSGGGFEAFYNRVRSQVDALIEEDPTAFYTYEEYLEAVETLYETVMLRAESISGQLAGTIPSTEEAQSGSDTLIDASDIDISVMGQMNGGHKEISEQ